jgi:mannose-6-phosphate isomerase-like protein (cupin superfamily)
MAWTGAEEVFHAMGIQILSPQDFGLLENPGVKSVQIVWGQNAPEAKATITRVTVEPGSTQERHSHEHSEQIWLVERGTATLHLADDQTALMKVGEVVRTPAGEIHGIINRGSEAFVYLAVTTPPQDFTAAYEQSTQP